MHYARLFANQAAAININSSSDDDTPASRRSTRARKQSKFFADEEDKMDVDSEEEAESSEEEVEVAPTRKSSRSTAFRGEMKDPSNSIADLLAASDAKTGGRSKRSKHRSSLEDMGTSNDDTASDDDSVPKRSAKNKKVIKSPAKRHTKKRMSKGPEHHSDVESSEEEEESESEGEEEEEEIKVSKIIAVKSLTLEQWKEEVSKINTTEITNGSRWIQEASEENPDKYEERFLVKWQDLSHLHCSWETEKDLVEFCEGAKQRIATFFRKSSGGLLYEPDERLDGVSCLYSLFGQTGACSFLCM